MAKKKQGDGSVFQRRDGRSHLHRVTAPQGVKTSFYHDFYYFENYCNLLLQFGFIYYFSLFIKQNTLLVFQRNHNISLLNS